MTRATSAGYTRRRKKRLFKQAKGFIGDRKNHVRLTKGAVLRAIAFSYTHRKHKKRDFRRLWIQRINAAAKMNGISYSKLIHGLKKAKCELDRKMLADLAFNDPAHFASVANFAKEALAV
jgi:large subunit ribosomal protein L20